MYNYYYKYGDNMGRKVEIINIKEYVYPKKNREIYAKNKLYCEKTYFGEIEYTLSYNLGVNDEFINLYKFFKKLDNRINKLYDDYLFLKLYRYIVKESVEYSNKKSFIEGNINKLRFKYLSLEREFLLYKAKEIFSIKDVEKLYEDTMFIVSFIKGLSKELMSFKSNFYKEFKLTSFLPVNGKKTNEIEELINRVDEEVSKFKNILEANDFFTYNSSNEIYQAIDDLLVINKKGVKLNYHYFIESDAIISFSYNDWLDLMTKFKFVSEKIKGKIDLPKKFIESYKVLETRFAIVLIAKEMN